MSTTTLPHERATLLARFPWSKAFPSVGDARRWLERNGYRVGETDSGLPIGVRLGSLLVSPWSKMHRLERDQIDGVILPQSPAAGLEGGVMVRLRVAASELVPASPSQGQLVIPGLLV